MSKSFVIFLSIWEAVILQSCKIKNSVPPPFEMGTSISHGKSIFESTCSRCHGMDASGLTGSSLRLAKQRLANDSITFSNIVKNGISGTAMPENLLKALIFKSLHSFKIKFSCSNGLKVNFDVHLAVCL